MNTPDQQDDGGPAFPETRWDDKTRQEVQWCGMSLRDYFAAAALTGIIANLDRDSQKVMSRMEEPSDALAMAAFSAADAMLRARRQQP